MKKTLQKVALALLVLLATAVASCAMTVGTFNIEYFNSTGKNRYEPSDMQALAATIQKSGADVLALQEIEGNATMRYFTTNALRGWNYVGNDTGGRQDLFFLWNPQKVTIVGRAEVYFANLSGTFEGKKYKLFDRPPLVAKFKDNESGKTYRLVCVHLKSQVTAGKKDADAAKRYNDAKRSAQIAKLNELAAGTKEPTFIMGDYNDEDSPKFVKYPMLKLEKGFSYDSYKSNIDFIGYVNIKRSQLGEVYETETRIERRSTKRKDHPDHDIVAVKIIG